MMLPSNIRNPFPAALQSSRGSDIFIRAWTALMHSSSATYICCRDPREEDSVRTGMGGIDDGPVIDMAFDCIELSPAFRMILSLCVCIFILPVPDICGGGLRVANLGAFRRPSADLTTDK